MPHGDYIQCPTEIIFNVPQISQIYTDLILYPEKNLCKSVKSVGLKKSIRGTKKIIRGTKK